MLKGLKMLQFRVSGSGFQRLRVRDHRAWGLRVVSGLGFNGVIYIIYIYTIIYIIYALSP